MLSPGFELSSSGFKGSNRLFEIIQKIGKAKVISKGKVIIRAGSPAAFFFYVRSGAFKTTVKTLNKNYIMAFTFADDIDCCPTALLNSQPNNFTIEAVRDSEVLICDFQDFKKTAGKDEFFTFVSDILIHYAKFLETQSIELLSLTAEQRYCNLIAQQSDKIKLVPLSLIASYLGITVERLSRIRKKGKI